jgi:DNA modification methylase
MYGWKGTNRKWTGASNESTVWDIPRQQGNSGGKREHPTEKPLVLFERCIRNHDAQFVLDPFAGSGTTLVACENLHRKCRGIEISPAYCAVTLERMSTAFPGIEIERL